jgi:hypothetical protein
MVNFSFNIATCHEARPSKKFEMTSLKMNFLKCFWMIWYSNFITKIILFLTLIDLRIDFTHPTIYSLKIISDDMQRHLWTNWQSTLGQKISIAISLLFYAKRTQFRKFPFKVQFF